MYSCTSITTDIIYNEMKMLMETENISAAAAAAAAAAVVVDDDD